MKLPRRQFLNLAASAVALHADLRFASAQKLNKEINAALTDARMKARIADLGGTVYPGSPADFASFIAAETEKWAKVVKFAGLKPE